MARLEWRGWGGTRLAGATLFAALALSGCSDTATGLFGSRIGSMGGSPLAEAPPSREKLSEPGILTAEESRPAAELIPGGGPVLGQLSNMPPLPVADHPSSLSFVEADVRQVAASILGSMLQVDYVIDPQVSGSVTARAGLPGGKEDLLPVLEEILDAHDATLIREGEGYRVAMKSSAGSRSPLRGAGDRVGFGVEIVPLSFISAEDARELLTPYAASAEAIRVDQTRNALLLSGGRLDRDAMQDMIRVFDVDWMAGMNFGLFPLSYADADALAAELRTVFAGGRTAVPGSESGVRLDAVRFLPIKRRNAILAITAHASMLRRVQEWVERLDQGTGDDRRRLYVYPVQNGQAVDLAKLVSEVFSTGQLTSRVETAENGAAATASVSAAVDGLRAIADERNNALLVMATPDEYRMVEAALRQLDIPPLQVLIEATIAEVTLNDELQYGVQWFLNQGASQVSLADAVTGVPTAPVAPGLSWFLSWADDRAILTALDSITDVNVVSSPKILVLDNQTAKLEVGDQVPVITQTAVSVTDPDAPIVNSVQFRDTGVILEVTPRVNASGLVTMEIAQEVSDVTETRTSSINSPTIQQRRFQSAIAIRSGQTVALGGLIRSSGETSRSGFPILSDLPGLGALFSQRRKAEKKTELLVLITPHVVHDQEQARFLTEELRRVMQGPARILLRPDVAAPEAPGM